MTTTLTGVDDGSTGFGVEGSTTQALFNNMWTAGARGESDATFGVYAVSQSGVGLYAKTASTTGQFAVWAEHIGSGDGAAGVYGVCNQGVGVYGSGEIGVQGSSYIGGGTVTGIGIQGTGEIGVSGVAPGGTGVMGVNGNGSQIAIAFGGGIRGDSDNGWGVIGTSLTYDGIRGENNGNGAAIHGLCHSSDGLAGKFEGNVEVLGGVWASSTIEGTNGAGSGIVTMFGGAIKGVSDNGWGVIGTSLTYDGVRGENNGNGAAIHGVCHSTGGVAGQFDGNVNINGTLQISVDIILTGADCAEEFDLAKGALPEPGTVMVMDPSGALIPCCRPYDSRAVGVISGDGSFRPALTLDRRTNSDNPRGAIALVGKVYCRVSAEAGSIAVGDLLTTSATPGHAMKVTDAVRAIGAIVGKAMGPLNSAMGTIPILVALQ